MPEEFAVKVRGSSRQVNLLQAQRKVLREMASGAPLAAVLERLSLEAEAMVPGMRCTILLLREGRLYDGASPSMPDFFRMPPEGLEIGPSVGSCGAAAYYGRRVVVEDVAIHPNWAQFREFAQQANIRACWSEPVFCSAGKVLGTLAMYYVEVRVPEPWELELIESMAQIAGIAIENQRTAEQRRETEERFRQLAENVRDVFWLTEWNGEKKNRVLYIGPAYEAVWGRSCQSLYDDPRSWAYGIHPEDRERVERCFVDEAISGGFDLEYRIVRPDGQERWIYDRAFPIRNERGEVYRVAGISEDITERKQAELALAGALRQLEARSRERENSLQTELLLAEERERRRLAIDMHDGLNQLLTLAQMKLKALCAGGDPQTSRALEEVTRLVAEADQRARSLSFQLSPPILHDLGFEAAVQWLVEDIERTYGLRVELEERGRPQPLDKNVSLLLYRACRELLVNVAKHAKADRARVHLNRSDETYEITVQDDGAAFDPREINGRGLGLSSIRERLESFGGRMQLASAPGRGTAVTLHAPVRIASSDAAHHVSGDS
jgi:PAS domain S-box-containing protein